jgi:UDP-2-acetamido-3-amino-2,3-dideoxy-glucuronate N-acetyltransferase
MNKEKSIKVAVIGCGYWGKNLVRAFKELGVLELICDTDRDKLRTLSEKYPDTKTTNLPEEVWKDNNIEAVAIATPASTHYTLAKQSLLRKKHVFVEKPLALKVEEGEELVNLAKDLNRILMVGHILNYHPAVLKLKEFIDIGELGRIEYIYSNRLNIGKLRQEENILWSFAPHDISAILMLLNEFPKEVRSFGGKYLLEGIYDTTLTTLDFVNGVKAHIFVSWLHPFKEQKLVVVGNKKMAVFDDLTEEKLFLYPHTIEWRNRVPIAQKAKSEVIPVEKIEPLKAECEHFLDCIIKGLTPKTDGKEGLSVLRLLSSCEESLRQDGQAIKLDRNEKIKEYFVHPSSYIDENVEIGEGSQIWHFSHVLKGSKIGKKCKIGQNVVIGPNVTIGDGCKIQNNVSIYEGVILEDEVFCGPSCVFTNVLNPRARIPRMKELRPTLVRKGTTIGANATIICGHTLGSYAFIGAGAVVTKDVPDYGLVIGNPGKLKGWMCECAEKLTFKGQKAVCKSCGKAYKEIKNKLLEI